MSILQAQNTYEMRCFVEGSKISLITLEWCLTSCIPCSQDCLGSGLNALDDFLPLISCIRLVREDYKKKKKLKWGQNILIVQSTEKSYDSLPKIQHFFCFFLLFFSRKD